MIIKDYKQKSIFWRNMFVSSLAVILLSLGIILWLANKKRPVEVLERQEQIIRCIEIDEMKPDVPYFIQLKEQE